MKIVCKKSDLVESVNIALRAVPSKTTMPILECILIKVENGKIKFTTNDMELGIETIVKGEIFEEGVVALSAKIFSEIIRRLPDNDVMLETDSGNNTKITCEKAKFNIAGRTGEEFPVLPEIAKNNTITISQFTLRELIRQTIFSISDNENNKIMTGELFEINESDLRVVTLDGHRISLRKVKLNASYGHTKVIVPGKTLNEISKILSGEVSDEVRIYLTDKHIMFELEDTIVLSRLIEGEYYKIDQMLSADYEIKVHVNKKDILSCLDRATLLIRENEKKPVIVNINDTSIELKMNTSIGTLDEEVSVQKEGKDMLIGFNPRFLIEALRVIDDDEIDMYMVNPKAPCFIKNSDETYIYLILPVNFNAIA